MGIPHRHEDAFMSHQLLDCPQVYAGHDKARGEGVAHNVGAKPAKACPSTCQTKGSCEPVTHASLKTEVP